MARMTRRQRLLARLFSWGTLLGGVCVVIANVDSLFGGGTGTRILRLVAGLLMVFQGLALSLDGTRPWAPPARKLVKAYALEKLYGIDGSAKATTISGRLLTGTIRMALNSTLFILGLVLVGFGVLELTRVP